MTPGGVIGHERSLHGCACTCAAPSKLTEPTDLYDHQVKLLDGGELDLASLRGKPTLFVNTAIKCGYTPQYEGLQKLYEHLRRPRPADGRLASADFADQEFDDAEEIGAFCQKNYGVSFPLTERTSVRADPSRCGQIWPASPIRALPGGTSPSTWSAPTAS